MHRRHPHQQVAYPLRKPGQGKEGARQRHGEIEQRVNKAANHRRLVRRGGDDHRQAEREPAHQRHRPGKRLGPRRRIGKAQRPGTAQQHDQHDDGAHCLQRHARDQHVGDRHRAMVEERAVRLDYRFGARHDRSEHDEQPIARNRERNRPDAPGDREIMIAVQQRHRHREQHRFGKQPQIANIRPPEARVQLTQDQRADDIALHPQRGTERRGGHNASRKAKTCAKCASQRGADQSRIRSSCAARIEESVRA